MFDFPFLCYVGIGENWKEEAFCIWNLIPHNVPLITAIMKIPKVAFFFIFAVCLVVYLTYVKRHYDGTKSSVSDQRPQYSHDPHTHLTSVHRVSANFQYGIMFDAGSTGTRIHIFKFQVEPNGRVTLLLHRSTWFITSDSECFFSVNVLFSDNLTKSSECYPLILVLLSGMRSIFYF